MYSQAKTFDYFLKHAKYQSCLIDFQLGTSVGVNNSESQYSRVSVFVSLCDSRTDTVLRFTFWDDSINIALIKRTAIVPSRFNTPAIYSEHIIDHICPNPNDPKLMSLTGWIRWACNSINSLPIAA